MEPLPVFYRQQFNDHACGAAALEMLCKYYGRATAFSQKSVFKRLSHLEPHGSGNYRISSDDLMEAARRRGLHAGWGRVSMDAAERLQQLDYFLEQERVPLIACQKYTDDLPDLGHFRVMLAFDDKSITVHDPCPKFGGASKQWDMEKFIDYWKYTGLNVTGGVAIWLADRPLNSPLAPGVPNLWYAEASR